MKTIRRVSAACLFLLASRVLLAGAHQSAKPTPSTQYIAYIGTYTTKTSSKGIYAYRFDAATGKLTPIGLAAESSDPSFLAIHPNGKYLYAVNESGNFGGEKTGAVSAFALDHKSGKLTLLNQAASGGADPCHISFDKTGKFVLVANYTGGSVAAFPVLTDGRLGAASSFVQHEGHSVNKERQEAAHAHWIETSPDNKYALVADLGLDEVVVYRFDPEKGSLTKNNPAFAMVNPGLGPRHAAFSPNGKFVYVLNELNSTVVVFSNDTYGPIRPILRPVQQVSALPKDFAGPNDAAEIVVHPTGKFLYASNRGHDSIAVFAIDAVKGTLTLVTHVPTKGKTPRNFAIDLTGAFLLAANQESDNIVVFRVDPKTGGLTPTGEVLQAPAPVCITFVPAE